MLINIPPDAAEEDVRAAFPVSYQNQLRHLVFYRSNHLAIVYFKDEGIVHRDLKRIDKIVLENGREMELAEVCLLTDIRPNAADNEMRLSRFKVYSIFFCKTVFYLAN